MAKPKTHTDTSALHTKKTLLTQRPGYILLSSSQSYLGGGKLRIKVTPLPRPPGPKHRVLIWWGAAKGVQPLDLWEQRSQHQTAGLLEANKHHNLSIMGEIYYTIRRYISQKKVGSFCNCEFPTPYWVASPLIISSFSFSLLHTIVVTSLNLEVWTTIVFF